jgi:hypothetical protein
MMTVLSWVAHHSYADGNGDAGLFGVWRDTRVHAALRGVPCCVMMMPSDEGDYDECRL